MHFRGSVADRLDCSLGRSGARQGGAHLLLSIQILQGCLDPVFMGCVFFWYRDVFFVVSRWPKSPFWCRDLSFLVSRSLHSVVQHLDRLLPGINLCMLFSASTSFKLEVKEDLDTNKKIGKSRYLEKDISIPTKRLTRIYVVHMRAVLRTEQR